MQTMLTAILIRWRLLLAVAVFVMQYPFTDSALLVKAPLTDVVVLGRGSGMRMECTRDQSGQAVDWEFAPAESNSFSYIYTNRQIAENMTSRYKIDTDNETRFDIVVDSVDSSYAGTYICTPVNPGVANTTSGSAQLIVLETNPFCSTNASVSNGIVVEGNYIHMWCSVKYTGNWIPIMRWNSSNQWERIINYTESTSLRSILLTPLYSEDDGVTIACKTSFNSTTQKVIRDPRPGEIPAENVPDYQYLWTFTPIVLYKPRDMTITPKRDVYEVGDIVVCSAKGNPTPIIEWTEMKTNRKINGSDLIIDASLISDDYHDFKCAASNTIDEIHSELSIIYTFKVTGSTSTAAANVLTVAAVIGEIALGFAIAFSVKA